jgi:hypothetical protein
VGVFLRARQEIAQSSSPRRIDDSATPQPVTNLALATIAIGSHCGRRGDGVVRSSRDEPAALAAADEALAAGTSNVLLYSSAMQALNRWCRKCRAESGPGGGRHSAQCGHARPGAAPRSDRALNYVATLLTPLGGRPGKAEQVAALLAWCVSEENSLMTGQVLFIDGGAECRKRGERAW